MQSLLFPDYYIPLSLALYQILEDSGASDEVRNLWKEAFTAKEIKHTIGTQPTTSVYFFGSSGEGTTIADMNPDLDMVLVDNRLPVITDCSYVPREKCLLLVHDNDTQAGYAKLQLVSNRVPLYQNDYGISNAMHFSTCSELISYADKSKRLVFSFNPTQGTERHGPAIFICDNTGRNTGDIVCAFNLPKLPGCVEEWATRVRNHNWPSADVIDHCKRLGCLFVPVGHPQSDEQHLEWRYSLSHQERLLVSQFNSVQHKCYMLLKLWKKDILPSWIGQDSLSSYHCKTSMFYMIENTPSDFWRPDNLLGCFVACLRLFLLWTTNNICPNYFIPAENMFDRRIHGELQRKLQQALEVTLTADCKYLVQIRSSHIGDRLLSYITMPLSNGRFVSEGILNYLRTKARLVMSTGGYTSTLQICMRKCFSIRSQRCLKNIYNFTQHLTHTDTITKHTVEETKRAVSYFVPYLELHLMTGIIALAKEQGKSREEIWQYLFSESWPQLSLRSDISVKLKQASFMYIFEYYYASLDILSSTELHGVYSMCNCYMSSFSELMALPTEEEMVSVCAIRPNVTVEHMANHLFVPCIVFLPTDGNVTPDAIRYEMLRFADDTPGYTDGLRHNYLRECAVVDGLFLYYFLLYLNHSKLNMGSHVRADISNMNYTISARDSIGRVKCSHREACLNILGWVYKDQGCIDTAEECFRRSLEMKPRGNAAVWHLRDIHNLNH